MRRPIFVLDARALETTAGIQKWLDHVFKDYYGVAMVQAATSPSSEKGVELLDELLRPTVTLHRLVHEHIEDDQARARRCQPDAVAHPRSGRSRCIR